MNVNEFGNCINVVELGRADYKSVWDFQKCMWQLRIDERIPDIVLLVEHDHVVTIGKSTQEDSLLMGTDSLADKGIPVYEIERGGDATYHGPGQLVAYPIFHLTGNKRILSVFIYDLEEVMIRTLSQFKISASRKSGHPGVWVGDKKIGSIGIAVKRWVSTHGFALNVNTDLSFFRYLKPCGLDSRVITSMAEIIGRKVDMKEVAVVVRHNFGQVFQVNTERQDNDYLTEARLVESPAYS